MRLKQVDNGTGAWIFHMDDDDTEPLPINGRFFHRDLREAIRNAAALSLIVYTDGMVLTDVSHHHLHRAHHEGTQVGHNGVNTCLNLTCQHRTFYNLVGRTALDVLLSTSEEA